MTKAAINDIAKFLDDLKENRRHFTYELDSNRFGFRFKIHIPLNGGAQFHEKEGIVSNNDIGNFKKSVQEALLT